jgi:hypothetical protein
VSPASSPHFTSLHLTLPVISSPICRSAYSIFFKSARPQIREQHPDITFHEYPTLCSSVWKGLSEEEKAPYLEAAAQDRERYNQELANIISSDGSSLSNHYCRSTSSSSSSDAFDMVVAPSRELEALCVDDQEPQSPSQQLSLRKRKSPCHLDNLLPGNNSSASTLRIDTELAERFGQEKEAAPDSHKKARSPATAADPDSLWGEEAAHLLGMSFTDEDMSMLLDGFATDEDELPPLARPHTMQLPPIPIPAAPPYRPLSPCGAGLFDELLPLTRLYQHQRDINHTTTEQRESHSNLFGNPSQQQGGSPSNCMQKPGTAG